MTNWTDTPEEQMWRDRAEPVAKECDCWVVGLFCVALTFTVTYGGLFMLFDLTGKP